MTRLLVTGGRNFADRELVHRTLDAIHAETPVEVLIHGAARGADTLAAEWACRRGVRPEPYPAKWDDLDAPKAIIRRGAAGRFYNAGAGFTRNEEMVRLGMPTMVVGFPGGPGTEHCLRCVHWARKAGAEIEVRIVGVSRGA